MDHEDAWTRIRTGVALASPARCRLSWSPTMTDDEKRVAELREASKAWPPTWDVPWLLRALDAAEKRVDDAERERDAWREMYHSAESSLASLRVEVERLRAAGDALRASLGDAITDVEGYIFYCTCCRGDVTYSYMRGEGPVVQHKENCALVAWDRVRGETL